MAISNETPSFFLWCIFKTEGEKKRSCYPMLISIDGIESK